jgi:hypothetical protein
MKISASLFLAAVLLAAGGCTTVSEAGYYWGNYPATLYAYPQDPSPESLAQHEEELQRLIDYAREKDLKPPPGIQAELGYIEQQRGNNDAAVGYYEAESNTYPEARIFLERLSSGLKSNEG